MFADVEAYAALGDHRSATPVDRATAQWLAGQAGHAGFSSTLQGVALRQFFADDAQVVLINPQGVQALPCWPLWYPVPSTLELPLGERGAALITFPEDARASIFKGSSHREAVEAAAARGARAVVAITAGESGDVIALNILGDARPWPIPVWCVGGRHASLLQAAAAAGQTVRLSVRGREESQAEGHNVIARRAASVPGAGRSIVVSTPHSGWFRCAGERGPGVALWLALARWAGSGALKSELVFAAVTGHEFGGLGMKAFLEHGAPRPAAVKAWLHLGAGFACWETSGPPDSPVRSAKADTRRGLVAPPELAAVLNAAFRSVPAMPVVTNRVIGETQILRREGYAAFGPVGAHRYHHTPSDLPSVATGPELLQPLLPAFQAALLAIDAKD